MGTRGNIRVHNGDRKQAVYLYTHDYAYTLPRALATALVRGESRWGDPSYLARIIFWDMIREEPDGITGFGIAVNDWVVDGMDRILDVNCHNQTVTYEGDWGAESNWTYSFTVFVADTATGGTR